MAQSRFHLGITVVVSFLVFAGLAITQGGQVASGPMQDADKVLDIERYPNEPLELVDINVGVQSVKHRIKVKSRNTSNQWGKDTVRFREKNEWFKDVTVRLRNVSDQSIYGLSAALHFQSEQPRMLFRMLFSRSRDLEREPLRPGEEIELEITDGVLNRTKGRVQRYKLNLDSLPISFSVDSAIFSDRLKWYRGTLLKRDSPGSDSWTEVTQPSALGANHAVQAKLLKISSPNSAAKAPMAECVHHIAGVLGFQCPGDLPNCKWIHELGSGGGTLSHFSMLGDCEANGITCTNENLHDRLVEDETCFTCPDADGDGYYSASCGGNDCNDNPSTGGGINPGATEHCSDGIDNNCNGLTDAQDTCACGGYEGDLLVGGGEIDCSLCRDGIDNDCDLDIDAADSGCSFWCTQSPVVVDVSGNGFDLTNTANGVNFDLNNDGVKERIPWTAQQSDDAWLVLDRNADGVITNGTELFGNFTPQPDPPVGVVRNGFHALARYDLAPQGGNGDGLITEQDTIFASLRLWQDKNHNGISETNELQSLKKLGLKNIECAYKEARRKDQYGNWFRYRAKVGSARDTRVSRWAWDVFLASEVTGVARNR